MKTGNRTALLALLLLACANVAPAQRPKISNAKVQERSAASGLKTAIDEITAKEAGPLWIGYKVPAKAKDHAMCCFDSRRYHGDDGSCCMGCALESSHGESFGESSPSCSPEPLPYAFVLLRATNREISRVRVFSGECPLDFAELPLFWLENVLPEQSIDFLAGLATAANRESDSHWMSRSDQAVMAVAMHDTPAADQALERLVQPGRPLALREKVVFWLGAERGKTGLELLRKYAESDSDEAVRKKAAFAISLTREPEAAKDLVKMARSDASPRVRGEAIFWLAQIGGRKEAEQITAAIEDDPETEVKKKAVFALSQMHDGQGVSLLINVARTNKNPAVRKQAIFWLGQSRDPRALDFLEEIVTK